MEVDEADVKQLAMFQQRVDAGENGYIDGEGVLHPTWDEMGRMAQEQYENEARILLRAVTMLGYKKEAKG